MNAEKALQFTIITTSFPKSLGKRMFLDDTGKLVKESCGEMLQGTYRRAAVAGISDFADVLRGLTHKDAFVFGLVEGNETGYVVTKAKKKDHPGAVARCKDDFGWGQCPGILFVDYDPPAGTEPMARDDLVSTLRSACPFLTDVKMIWRPSASSMIRNANTGDLIRGIAGQRLYIAVKEAGAIPRVGKAIEARLWLAGWGRYDISAAGSLLPRTLVDGSVWQPERFDFAGGTIAEPPLKQDILDPIIIEGTIEAIDPADVSELDAIEKESLTKARNKAAELAIPAAKKRQAEYIDRRSLEEAGPNATTEAIGQAKARLRAAIDSQVLFGDFILLCKDGKKVTVGEILDNPKVWHGALFADPLEPEYGNHDHSIARVNLYTGGRPQIHSFAHGGRRFRLLRACKTVLVVRGGMHNAVDATLEILRHGGEHYDAGDAIIRIVGQEMIPTTLDWFLDHLARVIQYERYDERAKKNVPMDPPSALVKRIMAKRGERGFKEIKAIATAPTMTADGRIIETAGLDEPTGLLLLAEDDLPKIPHSPTVEDAKQAFAELWRPFEKFPYAETEDRAVVLAALLTAVIRPCLDIAPAFGIDAPTAGSGKTLIARCLGIIATGAEPDISPPFEDEAETRKRIITMLMKGSGAILVDNVVGTIDGGVLAGVLTSKTFTDRILGTNQSVTVHNRALWMFTGNNLRPTRDLNRRILVARIDPLMEATEVYRREFDLDPADYCLRHRMKLVVAALTILRAYITAGRPRITRNLGTFEAWAGTVLQTVAWCAKMGIADVGDPTTVLDRQVESDPEMNKLSGLLTAWHAAYADAPTTVGKAIKRAEKDETDTGKALAEALGEIAAQGKGLNSKTLTLWIRGNAGKIVDGLKFERHIAKTEGLVWWMVRRVIKTKPGGGEL